MNKRALIALGVFVGLGVVYAVSEQSGGGGAEAPSWSVPALKESADRIEIVRQGETIVLEKKDGAWALTAPVSFPATKDALKDLLGLFEEPLGVDLKTHPTPFGPSLLVDAMGAIGRDPEVRQSMVVGECEQLLVGPGSLGLALVGGEGPGVVPDHPVEATGLGSGSSTSAISSTSSAHP